MDLTTIKDRIVSEISLIINEGAKILRIDTFDQYEATKKLGRAAADKAIELDKERLENTKPLRDEVDQINSVYNDQIKALKAVVDNMKTVVLTYDKEQERKRIEAQRKLEEEARKKREAEEAKAREQRAKEEAERRKAEEARQAEAEAKRKAQEEQDAEKRKQLEAEAEARRKESEKATRAADAAASKAETREAVAETIVAPVLASAKKGVTAVKQYIVEINDKRKLVEWLLANTMIDGMAYIEFDNGALNKLAQSTKGAIKIDGCTVVEKENLRIGR